MSFFSWMRNRNPQGVTPNTNPAGVPPTVGGLDFTPGDPEGVVFDGAEVEPRFFPVIAPSGWDGWPAGWDMPQWGSGAGRFAELIDIAWTCLDRNSIVMSAMPPYKTRGGLVAEPESWMVNPHPDLYAGWPEFMRQFAWDFQLGEAFVLATDFFSSGWPMFFHVVPPWCVEVDFDSVGRRRYMIGRVEVTDRILHVRYRATTKDARGSGPLECAGGKMLTAGVLAKYLRDTAQSGGVPQYTLETDVDLTDDSAQAILHRWVEARRLNGPNVPPVLDRNVSLKTHQAMSPKDMAMVELLQFSESRIAVLLGMPPFLVGLGSGGDDSMTYSNVSQMFEFHDRTALRPMVTHLMSALSGWALPRGTAIELNRDEYTRPSFDVRAEAWVKLVAAGIVSPDEVRAAERFEGEAPAQQPPTQAMSEITGGAA